MAAETIRDLFVRLGVISDTAEVQKFDKAIGVAKKGMEGFARIVKRGALVVGSFITSITAATVATAKAGDEAAKAAQRVAMTAEEYQEYAKAADLSGASTQQLEAGIRRMNKTVSDAAGGMQTAADSLSAIGIAADDLEDQRVADRVMTIAEGLLTIQDEAERAVVAARIFGEEAGPKLIPLLNQGAAGIEAMRQQARDLGMVLSNEAAAASEEFVDRLADAKDILGGLRNTIGAAFLPTFTELLTGFRDWFTANRALIQQRIEAWTDRVSRGMERLQTMLERVNRTVQDNLGGWESVIRKVTAALAALVGIVGLAKFLRWAMAMAEALGPILAALGGLTAPQVLAGLAAVAAAFLAIYLVVEDLLVFLRGGESALGAFLEQVQGSSETMDRLRQLGSELKRLMQELKPLAVVAGEALRGAIQLAIAGFAILAGEQIPNVNSGLDALILAVASLADFFDRVNNSAARATTTIGRVKAEVRALMDLIAQAPGGAALLQGTGTGLLDTANPFSGLMDLGSSLGGVVSSVNNARTSNTSTTNNSTTVNQNVSVSSTGDPTTSIQEASRQLALDQARALQGRTVGATI